MQSSHVLFLNDKLKALGHFADQVFEAISDYEVFHIISTCWVPAVKRAPILQPLRSLWDKSLHEYQQSWKKAEKTTIQQVSSACTLIKQRLQQNELLEDQEISSKFNSIERILNGEERVCLQPHYELAYDQIKSLLQLLFDKEKTEILNGLADIIYPSETGKKANPNAKPYIHSFSFSSSISDLYDLKKKKSRDNFHDAWIIWENLCLAHWCWVYGENFFKPQELAYDSIAACARSSFLLELHSVYCDMHAIKEKRKRPIGSSFFSQDRFKSYLKVLMNHILLFQEEIADQAEPENKIHALGLELNQNTLYLSVEWIKDKEACQYLLHTFQEKSAQLQTLLPLFNKKEEKIVSLSEHSSGNNSTKFLERMGLVKELKVIFVEKTSTNSVSFRGKYIELGSLSIVNQSQLIQQIEELPLVR